MAASLMPNVALNTLLRCGSGRNDGKIVCESLHLADRLAAAAAASTNDEHGDDHILDPSDSFCLSMDDELDWLDLHGHGQVAFFDRSHSTKASNLNAPSSRSASFSVPHRRKAAGAFLVFPKLPDSGELARQSHRRPFRLNKLSSSRTIFPPIAEPGSPKVTCIGRVRPIREKGAELHRKKSKRESPSTEKKKKAKSLWTPLAAVFRFRRLRKRGQDAGRESEESTPGSGSPAVGAPALGDMRKFESGRRPASYGAAAGGGAAGGRGCGRDWGDAGPATK